MYTLTCNDGVVFTGNTMQAIVRQMRRESWNAPERKQEYMYEVIDRVTQVTGCKWQGGKPTPATFLDFLDRAGVAHLAHITTVYKRLPNAH